LIAYQVVRHRLVDMAMRINAVQSTLELLAYRVGQGEKIGHVTGVQTCALPIC